MTYLKKEEVFFERNDAGELIAQEVTLELPNSPKILITPLSKGEMAEIAANAKKGKTDLDMDVNTIINHCKEPKFTEADRESLKEVGKISITNAIVIAIMAFSAGISQKEMMDKGKEAVIKKELEDFH